MSNIKAPHHRGTHQRRARAVAAAASANPDIRCAKCGRTYAEAIDAGLTPARAKWTGGHVNDGQVDGPLAPEHAHCNYSDGARLGNQRREPRSEAWYG